MVFTCPNCSSRYRVPEERFTRDQMRVKCRSCGLISTVTRPSAAPVAASAPVQSPTARAPQAAAAAAPAGSAAPVAGVSGDAARKKPRLFEHWYYLKGRERKGPYHFADLDKYAQAGVLTATTYVWHPTFDGWKKIRDVKILRPLLERGSEAVPPPLPGALPLSGALPLPGAPSLPKPVGPARDAAAPDLLADLKRRAEPAAPKARQPIHRTEVLVNLLDQLEQQQADERHASQVAAEERAAARAAEAGDDRPSPLAALAPEAEAREKRKIVDLLEKLDRADRQADSFDESDEAFFDAEATVVEARAPIAGEDLNDVLKQLAEEQAADERKRRAEVAEAQAAKQEIFADSIPDIEIPTEIAAPPTKAERKKLVQEFSLMIRHERANRKLKIIFVLAALLVVAGAAFGVVRFSEYSAERRMKKAAQEAEARMGLQRVTYEQLKPRAEEMPATDELAAQVEALRQKQIQEEEERLAREAARRGAIGGGSVPVEDEQPRVSHEFEYKIEEKKKDTLPAGSTIKPAEGGKEEIVIAMKSSALAKAAANTFSEEEMTNIIRKKMKRFNHCKTYTVGLERVRVLMDFTVGTSGTISRISLKADQPLPAELAECIRAEVLKWTFPPPDKPRSFTRNLILD